jgi:hypothetical protein
MRNNIQTDQKSSKNFIKEIYFINLVNARRTSMFELINYHY